MKYFYLPDVFVIDYEKQKNVFQFDKNGEYETNDPKLIEWMKKNKNFIRYEETGPKEPATPVQAEQPKMKCKKCNYETENKGELLAHYREHKKDGE